MRYVHMPTGTEVESETELPSVLFRVVTSEAEADEGPAEAKEPSQEETE